jgi:hypothetical protein
MGMPAIRWRLPCAAFRQNKVQKDSVDLVIFEILSTIDHRLCGYLVARSEGFFFWRKLMVIVSLGFHSDSKTSDTKFLQYILLKTP